MVSGDARDMIAAAYRREVSQAIRWREIWKKSGDIFEASAKGLTGVASVIAFASSAERDPETSSILSFVSGTVGTLGLVILLYSGYAIRESRQRTEELNSMLQAIGVTPVPNIAPLESVDIA